MSAVTSFDWDVFFTDSWSEGIYTLEEVAQRVAEDPNQAWAYHIVKTNTTYAQYVAVRSAAAHRELIWRVAADITAATITSTQDLYSTVVGLCQRELGAQAGALFLEDPARRELRAVAASGYATSLMDPPAAYEMGQGITGRVWETGQAVRCGYRRELVAHPWRLGKFDRRQWSDETQCENVAFVPIRDAESTFGVLKVENKRVGIEYSQFSDRDLATLSLVASLIAFSVRFPTVIDGEAPSKTCN